MNRELYKLLQNAEDQVRGSRAAVASAQVRAATHTWGSYHLILASLKEAQEDIAGLIDTVAFEDVDKGGIAWRDFFTSTRRHMTGRRSGNW